MSWVSCESVSSLRLVFTMEHQQFRKRNGRDLILGSSSWKRIAIILIQTRLSKHCIFACNDDANDVMDGDDDYDNANNNENNNE